jgi:hypothetical protein
MIPLKTFRHLRAAGIAFFIFTAAAQAFTLNPTIDALVSAANPANNYGGAGALAVSSLSLSKGEFDSVLMFNFAAAKASFDTTFGAGQWAVSSITLQLTSTAPNNSLFNGYQAGPGPTNINYSGSFSATWMQNNSWTEGTGTPNIPTTTGITYSTLQSTYLTPGSDQSLGTFSIGSATSGNTTWTLSLASSLLTDATAGNQTSLLLTPASGDTTLGMLVNSRTGGSPPVLTVTAGPVPEPGTSALLAGMVFVWITRRRHHARAA